MTIKIDFKNKKSQNIKNIMNKNYSSIQELSRFSSIETEQLQLYINGYFGILNDYLDLSLVLECDINDILDTDNYIKWVYETQVKEQKMFDRYSLDISFVEKICNSFANYYHYFKNSEKNLDKRKYGTNPDHWNFFTATLDRIRSTSYYLKYFDPKQFNHGKIALAFYDLLGHVYNLSSYTNELLKYFNITVPFSDKHVVFTSTRSLTGNDDKYISYLRALVSSNHSIATSQHKDYIGKNDTHNSPFASWDSHSINGVPYDINILIRTNSKSIYDYYISTTELYKYIQMKLYSLVLVLEKLEIEVQNNKNKCASEILKKEEEFDEFYQYVEYLNSEHEIRICNQRPETYEFYTLLFNMKINEECIYINDINAYKQKVKDEIINRSNFIETLDYSNYNHIFDELYMMYSNFINENDLGYELSHISFNTNNIGYSSSSRINSKIILNKIYNDEVDFDVYTDDELLVILNAALYKVSIKET